MTVSWSGWTLLLLWVATVTIAVFIASRVFPTGRGADEAPDLAPPTTTSDDDRPSGTPPSER